MAGQVVHRATAEAVALDNNAKTGRLTIAVLLDHLNFFGRGYEGQLRDALHARCRDQGHNLLFLYGGPLAGPNPLGAADNAIFHLLRPADFDGIIVVSTLLSTDAGVPAVGRLIERFHPANLCSIGAAFPGVPSVVLDNRVGMELAVEHLVRVHGRRRLAFLAGTSGNPEAEVRFQAYKDVLERNGIAHDPALVARGDFLPNLGRAAMDNLMAAGISFDGVVAANDSMAIGAIQALRRSGRRVPQDIPVTGFDDLTLARLGNPPLTTVAQPFHVVADLAVSIIEDQVTGRAVTACTQVPSQFVRRQSCGCGYQTHVPGAEALAVAQTGPRERLRARIGALKPVLADILRTALADGSHKAALLCDGLAAEVDGEKEAFHKAVTALLVDVSDDSERNRTLQSAIHCMRNEVLDHADPAIERAIYDGLSLVALSNTTAEVQHRLDLDHTLRLLSESEQSAVAFDLSSLKESLGRGFPAAGVHTVLFSCVPEDNPAELESVICLVDGTAHEPKLGRFPSSQLIPPEVLGFDRANTFLLFPLVYHSQLLGVIAFDHSDGNNAYLAFRNQIAAALAGIRLHRELVERTMLHERSVQERLVQEQAATSKRLEALSVLAGGVAHDLNNALGPLVAIPDVILHDLDRLPIDQDALKDLRLDIESIKTAAQRTARTVKDLLTLGRQGRTAKEDLEFNRVVKSCLANNMLRLADEGSPRVQIRADLAPEPLTIRGSESQLARAVSNVVRNAVEAVETVDGRGEVTVKSSTIEVTTPIAGYETIPPGHYAVLTVSDDGRGIPERDLARIFEPFFTKKRAGESSGTGLGLAIVHGVVKEHDGYVDVTSTPHKGTTFSLYLPCLQTPAQPLERFPTAPGGHGRILVVDDEPMLRHICERVLAKLGYQVETCASGADAYEIFHQAAKSGQSPFDLVMMDMILGEAEDGLQALERIQCLFPHQKAIVASGHAPSERAEMAMRKGLSWLAKPYSTAALARSVELALEADESAQASTPGHPLRHTKRPTGAP